MFVRIQPAAILPASSKFHLIRTITKQNRKNKEKCKQRKTQQEHTDPE